MIAYRPATPDDASGIEAVAREASWHHHRLAPAVFARPAVDRPATGAAVVDIPYPQPDAIVIVAEAEETIVGFVHAECLREERAFLRPCRYLKTSIVAVLPAHRSHGIGSELMARVERWGRSRGCTEARLNVWAVNARAAALYRERGYVAMSTVVTKALAPER